MHENNRENRNGNPKKALKESRTVLCEWSQNFVNALSTPKKNQLQTPKQYRQSASVNDENQNPNLVGAVNPKTKSKMLFKGVDFLKPRITSPQKKSNKEKKRSQGKNVNQNSHGKEKEAAKTPSRSKVQEVEILDSPFKSPHPDDFSKHHQLYTDKKKTDNYYDKKRHLLEGFRQWVSNVTGDEVGSCQWRFQENGTDDPWNRLCINTASNFCDRNQGEAYQSPRAFASGIKQCCSLATRREGVSMVFLRNPKQEHRVGKKTRYAFYRTSEFGMKPIELVSKVLPKSLEDACTEIERIYATAAFDERENKSLVMNVGFLNLVNQFDATQIKKVAVITANGIYTNEEAQKQMERVQAVIRDISPEIDVYIVPKDDMPIVRKTGTREHCETVFADLVQGVFQDDQPLWENVIRGSPWCVEIASAGKTRESRLNALPKQLFAGDDDTPLAEKRPVTLTRTCSSAASSESESGKTDREDSSDSDQENKNPNTKH